MPQDITFMHRRSSRKSKPLEQLDNLYNVIFRAVDEEVLPITKNVPGVFLINLTPRPNLMFRRVSDLEDFLGLNHGDVQRSVFGLESLVHIGTVDYNAIEVHHASLSDYFFDKSRSGLFWVETGIIYALVVERCLYFMSKDTEYPWLRESGIFKFLDYDTALNSSQAINTHYRTLFSRATPTRELRQAIETCDMNVDALWNLTIEDFRDDGEKGFGFDRKRRVPSGMMPFIRRCLSDPSPRGSTSLALTAVQKLPCISSKSGEYKLSDVRRYNVGSVEHPFISPIEDVLSTKPFKSRHKHGIEFQ
ncbi:hypothetical protein CPB84DRAFT_1742992 [Gymnopilus junonius]|uniref:Uncharacterized protein n=1 Tax=Gymnopilus junonius TaxID=109634 RepID=A0A9P5TTX5_GYMJU|nr:hypothetical protein CPB84DRAFT_1742992 [Gymnopilus junonius]